MALTPKQREEQLNRLIRNAATQFDSFTTRQVKYALAELRRTENILIAKLAEATGDDGKVKRERLQSLLKDVRTLRRDINADILGAMDTTIRESAGKAFEDLGLAFEGAKLGSLASMGVQFDRMNEYVFKYTVQRFGDDGLVLSDRVWNLSGTMSEDLNTAVRNAIIQGQSLSQSVAAVRAVYDAGTYAIRRLVVTETNTAYRAASMFTAQNSRVVNYVRIHRGEADRPEHKCTIYSKEDKYGEGAGVFLPTDTKILNPHPNCTSWLEYIVDRELASSRARQQEIIEEEPPGGEQPDTVDEMAEALGRLEAAKSRKDIEKWVARNTSISHATFKDYDPKLAKEVARQAYVLQSKYPEGMARLAHLESTSDYYTRLQEALIQASIEKNRGKGYTDEYLYEYFKKSIKKKRVDPRAIAFASNNQFGINGVFFNPKYAKKYDDIAATTKESFDSGWLTVGSPSGTLTHEYGHMLDYWLQANHPAERKKLIADRYDRYASQSGGWWKEHVSTYARTNDKELFAETFADYVHNGDNAKPVSKEMGHALDELLAKLRKGGN